MCAGAAFQAEKRPYAVKMGSLEKHLGSPRNAFSVPPRPFFCINMLIENKLLKSASTSNPVHLAGVFEDIPFHAVFFLLKDNKKRPRIWGA